MKRILILLIALSIFVLCGCENPLDGPQSPSSQVIDSSIAESDGEESKAANSDGEESKAANSDGEEDSSVSDGSSLSDESSLSDVTDESAGLKSEALKVHFIDVAQGDSIFIELPNGECMLIDAGERDYAGRIISLIDCLGYKKIDYLVATHPHSDHIGGMQRVVESFEIGEVYMPDAVSNTNTFINLLGAFEERELGINVVTAGEKLTIGEVLVTFVAPKIIVDDLNNCSIVTHLAYGNRAFLFTGDAEMSEELTITADIACDVLKVGHHGSYTSSSEQFLKKASPEIAVISCGTGNEYGHPHDAALQRLEKAGVEKIYRTDLSGTVTVITDGASLDVSEGYQPSGYKWVLNIGGKKLHTPECRSATDMKAENKAYSTRTLEELQALGYELCGSCKPAE